MQITFLGAANTVTGSKFLVETPTTKILVDCGLYQGLKELRLRNWADLPVNADELDAIVLTHAHIDHSGMIPAFVKQGFRNPVYCTEPTRDLCSVLLPDSGYLQEEDAFYANKKRYSKHSPALPLYTMQEAVDALKYLRPQAPHQQFSVGNLTLEFSKAGHILGAASVKVTEDQRGAKKSVLFSGDLGRYNDLLEIPPEDPLEADVIVMESTYGNRNHPMGDPVQTLADIIERVADRGGTLIIPAFAVGRAQTLIYAISQAFEKGYCRKLPVYLNSPMASKVTGMYRRHLEWHRLNETDCEDHFSIAKFVGSVEESKALHKKDGPKVIISASGMLTGGRVLHHIAHFAPFEKNAILLAGFQAPGTRGATLAAGGKQLKMHGGIVDIAAEVILLDIFSAHADQADLLSWLSRVKRVPKEVVLVHGEPPSTTALQAKITEELGWKTTIAEHLATVSPS